MLLVHLLSRFAITVVLTFHDLSLPANGDNLEKEKTENDLQNALD